MASRALLLPQDTLTRDELQGFFACLAQGLGLWDRGVLPCTARLSQNSISCPGNAKSRAGGSRSHSHAQEGPRALAELGTGTGK